MSTNMMNYYMKKCLNKIKVIDMSLHENKDEISGDYT